MAANSCVHVSDNLWALTEGEMNTTEGLSVDSWEQIADATDGQGDCARRNASTTSLEKKRTKGTSDGWVDPSEYYKAEKQGETRRCKQGQRRERQKQLENSEAALSVSDDEEECKTSVDTGESEKEMSNLKYAEKLVEILTATRESIDQIRGKDIIVLLGNTGVGKSTSINFLCGRTMKIDTMETPGDDSDDECVNFISCEDPVTRIGPPESVDSETSVISIHETNDGVAFCDTPGFEDTKGFIQDFANAVNIAAALRSCRSFKIMYLTREFTSGTGIAQGITRSIHTIGCFVRPLRNVISGMTMFVSKGHHENSVPKPKMVRKQIKNGIKYHSEIENGKYREACEFFSAMSTRSKDPKYLPYLVINPLSHDRTAYLNILKNLHPIKPDTDAIEINFPFQDWQIAKIERAFDTLTDMALQALSKDNYLELSKFYRSLSILSDNFQDGSFRAKKGNLSERINTRLFTILYMKAVKIVKDCPKNGLNENQAKELGEIYSKLQSAAIFKRVQT